MTARASLRQVLVTGPTSGRDARQLLDAYRAEVLNEAADAVAEMVPALQREWPDEPSNSPWAHGTHDAEQLLRRRATGGAE